MKFNKSKLEHRFVSSHIKPKVEKGILPIPMSLKDGQILDKYWKIIIPGTPISDSRPRHTNGGLVYNPNKAILMKIIDKVLEDAEPEFKNEVCVLGPMRIDIDAHIKLTKKMVDLLKNKYPYYYKLLLDGECMRGPVKKDNDNFEKVTWDCFQSQQIILQDEHVIENYTTKHGVLYSELEYVEINIYYTDESTLEKDIVMQSKEYLAYQLSSKYKRLNKIPDSKWKKTFYSNIVNYYKGKKVKEVTPDLLKPFFRVLDKMKAPELELIESQGKNVKEKKEIILANIKKLIQNS